VTVHDCLMGTWVCIQPTARLDACMESFIIHAAIFTGLDKATRIRFHDDTGWVIDAIPGLIVPDHVLSTGLNITAGVGIALNVLADIGLVSNRGEAACQSIGTRIRATKDVATIVNTG